MEGLASLLVLIRGHIIYHCYKQRGLLCLLVAPAKAQQKWAGYVPTYRHETDLGYVHLWANQEHA